MKNIELIRPHPATTIPTLLNLTAIGLLAGLSFCVQFGLVPALNRMDASAYLGLMREIIPTFTFCVKPLMAIGLATFLVRLFLQRPNCRGARFWLAVGFAFFATGAIITLAGHFPINHRLLNWQLQNSSDALPVLRVKWNQLNFWRFAAAQLCFICVLIPVAFGKRAQQLES